MVGMCGTAPGRARPRLPRSHSATRPPPTHLPQAVSRSEGESLAREYGMHFYETSAKKDIGVAEAFSTIARQVVGRLGDGGRDGKGGAAKAAASEKVDVSKSEGKGGKAGCCAK